MLKKIHEICVQDFVWDLAWPKGRFLWMLRITKSFIQKFWVLWNFKNAQKNILKSANFCLLLFYIA